MPSKNKRRSSDTGFSLVEVVLALGVAAGALTMVTALFTSLVADAGANAGLQACDSAVQTVHTHVVARSFSQVVRFHLVAIDEWESLGPRDTRVWWVDRSGGRILATPPELGEIPANPTSDGFFEVALIPWTSGTSLIAEIERGSLRGSLVLSWPAFAPDGTAISRENRNQRQVPVFLQR